MSTFVPVSAPDQEAGGLVVVLVISAALLDFLAYELRVLWLSGETTPRSFQTELGGVTYFAYYYSLPTKGVKAFLFRFLCERV